MNHVFLSHASDDKPFVEELRKALEGQGIPVWLDNQNLRGGQHLHPEIEDAIDTASHFMLVISPATVNSTWVRIELKKALEIEKASANGYAVIPVLLPGIKPSALGTWFDVEPLAVPVEIGPGGLNAAMSALLAALGRELPGSAMGIQVAEAKPIAELVLTLRDPQILEADGERRGKAIATVTYEPADTTARRIESGRFTFEAPLGPIETEDLRWYLEEYFRWPVGVFAERARRIEARLPQWGQALHAAALKPNAAQQPFAAWVHSKETCERRFSVEVDADTLEGATDEQNAAVAEAASALLALPWELVHDDRGYLFLGMHGVRVRRRLPNRIEHAGRLSKLPVRVLLVSPRPEDARAGYIDHRVSARPLVEAVEALGDLVGLTVLVPPTYGALEEALVNAKEGEEFDVVHFDGHGVYDREHGLGALCFEDPADSDKLENRAMDLIDAVRLAAIVRDHRVPVVFLEACQSAKTDKDPTASVAAKLLEEGVTSVVAMSHSVLVETARRFVEVFYQQLAAGARVGQAMLAGQRALYLDPRRGKVLGAGDLNLYDWFVPVLYQEAQDPQLFNVLLPEDAKRHIAKARKLSLGALPAPPEHCFIGRSRDLLKLERLLHREQYAVVRGQGGCGKTTLAAELARWLVRTGRFDRAAFVAMDTIQDVRSVLDSFGRQLILNYSVAQFSDLEKARQPVDRALREARTILVLDNLESVLPDASGQAPPEAAPVNELFELCRDLLDADPATRIVFTSRESLPAPFDYARREVELGALTRNDAVELVAQVMKDHGLEPKATDPGGTPDEITELVEAVNFHARALVLVAREVSKRGVRATTENLHELMAEMERKHPGDRENSLYASVELSLRRLSPEVREQAKVLAVFHGGASLSVVLHMLGLQKDDTETVRLLGRELTAVGLASDPEHGHLQLNPALTPYLLSTLAPTEIDSLRARWASVMMQLARFISQQRHTDAQLAARLTLLELPNLLALLAWMSDQASPEDVVGLASSVEQLLAPFHRPQALAVAVQHREAAARQLGAWGHAQFEVERLRVERLLAVGDLSAAFSGAEALLQRSLTAGEGAYPEAEFDIAGAHFMIGRVMGSCGNAASGLDALLEANRRFQSLADAGSDSADRMVSATLTESGDCLTDLGRLDDAANAYEASIERSEKRGRKRDVAVGKSQLGAVRMLQRRNAEALRAFEVARDTFTALGELGGVAASWHQIGIIHRQSGQLDAAERAHKEALTTFVREKERAHEASSLGELGTLYNAMGRLEESAALYRQAADIAVALKDPTNEGKSRSNLSVVLVKLGRYEEARREILRAVECKQPFGHAAEPWKTWEILHNLEQAVGNGEAAAESRRKAVECYLAYRRDGGENQDPGAQLYAMVGAAIQQGDTTEVGQLLVEGLATSETPSWFKNLAPKLQTILAGDHDPSLADDLDLRYTDAVELTLLLDHLRENDRTP